MGPFGRGKCEWATPVYTKGVQKLSHISKVRLVQQFKVFSELLKQFIVFAELRLPDSWSL